MDCWLGVYFSGVNISQFKFRIRTDYFGLVYSIFFHKIIKNLNQYFYKDKRYHLSEVNVFIKSFTQPMQSLPTLVP